MWDVLPSGVWLLLSWLCSFLLVLSWSFELYVVYDNVSENSVCLMRIWCHQLFLPRELFVSSSWSRCNDVWCMR